MQRLAAFSLVVPCCVLVGCHPVPDVSKWHAATVTQSWPSEAGTPIPVPKALSGLDWLANVSAYGHTGPPTDRGHSGSFGVGNGNVFGLIGLDEPRNTITGDIGPNYQNHGGFFGDSSFLLMQSGTPLTPEMEQAQRPRGTAIARTLAQAGPLTWTTTDVAPPGVNAIVRHITVSAASASDNLSLRLTLARSSTETVTQLAGALAQVRGPYQLNINCPGNSATAGLSTLDIPVPALAAGEEWSTTCLYQFSTDGNPAPVTQDAATLLTASQAATAAFLAQAAQLDVPDPKVLDLVEGMLITFYVQTAPIGVVSPMSRYTNGWLRDEEGPIRLYLALGMHDAARAILDAGYKVMVARQSISNSFPLDLDISGVTDPADPASFWASASFMTGYQPVESPSFAPLLTGRYVDHSGDTSILSPARLAFLDACLERQQLSAQALLPFSGDEDFRYPWATVLGTTPESIGWSANSSFLLAAAADRLGRLGGPSSLAEVSSSVRAAVEQYYWVAAKGLYAPIVDTGTLTPLTAPFEDVSTQPLWTGYSPATDAHASANVAAYLHDIWRGDGTIVSPTAAFYTGMVPGYLLQNLTALGRNEEEAAFNALDAVASPSGHFEELIDPDNLVAAVAHDPDGTAGDIPARYRPWEGGVVTWAMFNYLFGAQPDATANSLAIEPHMPNGWPVTTAHGLKVGGDTYDLTTREFREGRIVTIARGGTGPTWTAAITLHGTAAFNAIYLNGTHRPASASRVTVSATIKPGATATVIGTYSN